MSSPAHCLSWSALLYINSALLTVCNQFYKGRPSPHHEASPDCGPTGSSLLLFCPHHLAGVPGWVAAGEGAPGPGGGAGAAQTPAEPADTQREEEAGGENISRMKIFYDLKYFKEELEEMLASLSTKSDQLVATLRTLEKSPRAAGDLERIFGDESLCLRNRLVLSHWSRSLQTVLWLARIYALML